MNKLFFAFLNLLIIIIIASCSSNKKAETHTETLEVLIEHKMNIECDFEKKKKCTMSDDFSVTRDAGFSKPVFAPKSDQLIDHKAIIKDLIVPTSN